MHELDPNDDETATAEAPRAPMLEGTKSRIQRAIRLSQRFEHATRASRDGALAAATLEIVPGGTHIVQQGALPDTFILLGRGRVRIERHVDGGRIVPLGYRGGGDVLGEAFLGHASAHAESALALEETEVIRIPLPALDALMAADPALHMAMLGVLQQRKREAEARIASLLLRNVECRVIEFLLDAANRWGIPSPRGTLIAAPVTHLEIAQAIGSTRETVTLTLGALRRDSLLDVSGRRLIVKNREGLSARQAP